jgi:hypothetical protein
MEAQRTTYLKNSPVLVIFFLVTVASERNDLQEESLSWLTVAEISVHDWLTIVSGPVEGQSIMAERCDRTGLLTFLP